MTIPGDLELQQIRRRGGIGLWRSGDPGEKSSPIGSKHVI